jgi:HAD superfamily hydrolase (TIGR01509 family)
MLKALIFDFDGLILDTETPEYLAWKDIYQEYGFELPSGEWGKIVGGFGLSDFDAAEHLSQLLSSSPRAHGQLDSASLRARHRSESGALIHAQEILPGVLDMIHQAKQLGIKLAIASSSPHAWVDAHAERLGILHHFEAVICADDVGPRRTKPNPDLFLLALKQLQVQKEEAVVFEDSPNGVTAARRAGIFVVAVPNPVTSLLSLDGANLVAKSLKDISLIELNQLI